MTGPFKMKNSALHKGAKHGTPIQKNYGSPGKFTEELEKAVDDGKITGNFADAINKDDSPADMYNSPAKIETEGKERLAKQKIRTEKNKAFYGERSSEFSKDDSGVYRDTKGLSVSERRRISNKEKRRKAKTN